MPTEKPPTAWRVLADDLTGALDTAAVLGGGAADVPVFLGRPGNAANGISVVATATRDVAPETLAEHLAPSLDWLAGGDAAYKKLDSLLRGNSFAELAWLQKQQPRRFRHIVFAPAYPAQGRFTGGNRHWVGQPGSPGSIDDLQERFARHGLRAIMGDTLETCLRLAAAAANQPLVLVPEVLDDSALDSIAAWQHRPESREWLWAGSAGLAQALGREHHLPAVRATLPLLPADQGLLLVTCSRHAVVRDQLARLLERMPDGLDLYDLSQSQPLTPERADALLQTRARDLALRLPRPGLLLVVGGDTLLALCRAAGVHALRAGACARPGWGQATLIGGAWDGVTCLSRSGAFGGPHDLIELTAELIGARPSGGATAHPQESTA
jgi:uncharacterized protein YgbK (DUF1537 family)